MRAALVAIVTAALVSSPAQAEPFHDKIPRVFQGTWASTVADCNDPDGVNLVFIDGASVNYYEANDYLLIGVEFSGGMTKGEGSGSLFNGRFTGRSETALLGESDIRMEIDDRDKNAMYRYPIGEDGEPIVAREVRDVRCVNK